MRKTGTQGRNVREQGNILFMILLAVVLFAALSYAVTNSIQGGSKDGSGESQSAKAAEILNYFSQIDTAIKRMMLIDNIRDYELNFFYLSSSKFAHGGYDNTNCTASRCRVFDPAGGNISGRNITNMCRTGGTCNNAGNAGRIFIVSIPGAGTTLPDLVWVYYGTNVDLCKEINRKMGLNEIINSGITTESASTFLYYYNPYPTGEFPASTVTMSNIPQEAGIAGTFCGCTGSTESGCSAHPWSPFIFHVLVAR